MHAFRPYTVIYYCINALPRQHAQVLGPALYPAMQQPIDIKYGVLCNLQELTSDTSSLAGAEEPDHERRKRDFDNGGFSGRSQC